MNKEVEEVLEDIKWLKDGCQEWINYSKIGSNGRNISVNKRCCNITQHIKELAEENALLKRDLDTRNLMRKLTVDKVQSKLDKVQVKLDKIEDVVNNIFKEYTQSNGKYSFSGNDLLEIKSIRDKE